MPDPLLAGIKFTAAAGADAAGGILAWAVFDVAGLRIDGATVRRRRDGRVVVTLPERRDGRGYRHRIVRPLNPSVRRQIEAEILAAFAAVTPVVGEPST